MELDWSEQSSHIRTLFHPWQPGDGYDEATIRATEVRLGLRLPITLRNFNRAWGRRKDLAKLAYPLLAPDYLEVREETLQFWVENQAILYWGIPRAAVEEVDPPVVVDDTLSGPELHWEPSHAHLSSFLDDITYFHAFIPGGAIHGGWTRLSGFQADMPAGQMAWLEEEWKKATVTPLTFGMDRHLPVERWPTLYVRDGQAFWWRAMAARNAEALEEIGWRFRFPWLKRW
jgi:hypothetical protein